MSVVACIILDTRRVKENSKYPVKLWVNHQRVTNYYPTIYDLSQDDYDKLSAPRLSAYLQSVKNDLKAIEYDALEVISGIQSFFLLQFEKSYISANRFFRQRKRKAEPVMAPSLQMDDFDFVPYQKKFPILLQTGCEKGTSLGRTLSISRGLSGKGGSARLLTIRQSQFLPEVSG